MDVFGIKKLSIEQVILIINKLKNLREINVEPSMKDTIIKNVWETERKEKIKITCSCNEEYY